MFKIQMNRGHYFIPGTKREVFDPHGMASSQLNKGENCCICAGKADSTFTPFEDKELKVYFFSTCRRCVTNYANLEEGELGINEAISKDMSFMALDYTPAPVFRFRHISEDFLRVLKNLPVKVTGDMIDVSPESHIIDEFGEETMIFFASQKTILYLEEDRLGMTKLIARVMVSDDDDLEDLNKALMEPEDYLQHRWAAELIYHRSYRGHQESKKSRVDNLMDDFRMALRPEALATALDRLMGGCNCEVCRSRRAEQNEAGRMRREDQMDEAREAAAEAAEGRKD